MFLNNCIIDQLVSNILILNFAPDLNLKFDICILLGERALLVPWTRQEQRDSLSRFYLYCVPVNTRGKLTRFYLYCVPVNTRGKLTIIYLYCVPVNTRGKLTIIYL